MMAKTKTKNHQPSKQPRTHEVHLSPAVRFCRGTACFRCTEDKPKNSHRGVRRAAASNSYGRLSESSWGAWWSGSCNLVKADFMGVFQIHSSIHLKIPRSLEDPNIFLSPWSAFLAKSAKSLGSRTLLGSKRNDPKSTGCKQDHAWQLINVTPNLFMPSKIMQNPITKSK